MNASENNTKKIMSFFKTRTLGVLLVIAFITVRCGEGNDATNCHLTMSNIAYTDGSTEKFTYTFNSDNRLAKWMSEYTSANNDIFTYSYEYTYDLAGNVILETYDDGSAVFTYNNDNQVIKEEYYDQSTLKGIIENTYNDFGQIIKRQFYSVSGEVATEDYYRIVEYATTSTKNVLSSKKYSQDGTLISTIEYQYDNKKGPWTSMGLEGLFGYGENNTTKIIRTEGLSVQTDSFSYKYNQQGYPREMKHTNNDGVITYTEAYKYSCK